MLAYLQMKRSIPFVVVGGQPFWSRKEVKDVMAYIKLAVNPEDNLSLIRILNYPTRGIGNESQVKLQKWAEAQNKTLGQALFPDYQASQCDSFCANILCEATKVHFFSLHVLHNA